MTDESDRPSTRVSSVRPQRSLKLLAAPEALWRSGAYFVPGFVHRRRHRHDRAGLPRPSMSLGGVASVLADEVVLAGFKITRDPPTAQTWDRIEDEVERAVPLFEQRGWFDDPASYHQAPSIPPDLAFHPVDRWEARGLPWQQLRWTSSWTPDPEEPGAARWGGYDRNERASAWMLRHDDDRPRHWAIVLHGTEQGRLLVDQRVFRARHLFAELGVNVLMPILPLHASRRPRDPASSGFPTLDVLDDVHGLAQSAHDVRCLLAWVRDQQPAGVSVTGLSLGGGVAALVAGLEVEPLDAVVCLVPAVDLPEVFRRQTPRHMRREEAFERLGASSQRLHEVVSPLAFSPSTPSDRRFVLAGLHDRLLDPLTQAGRLAEHWGVTDVRWLDRGHVTHLGGSELGALLDSALRSGSGPRR